MSQTAFERYAPFIQEYIYRKNWTDLREVQIEACEAILDTESHVIIASGTASGKTEAAFFPILTMLHGNPSESIGVMYIGPLKALINDQFERLSGLLEDSYIPVWPWHGDISQSVKKKALKETQGILQITPESLEALIMSRPGDVRRLFVDLRFVVIDEIHALMGTDRGLQVMCLLARLERIADCKPRRIGLSATLNDYESAKGYIAADTERQVMAVGIESHKRTISLSVESFVHSEDRKQKEIVFNRYNEFIYEHCHDKKCLIFTNSRGRAEQVISDMKTLAQTKKERDVFYVHHGSVSAALRHETEIALRENEGPTVAAATLTLELGIDIGDLDTTVQLGAPFSCASFVQRLGRSGRRTGKSQMMFVNLHEQKNRGQFDFLPWDLLRTIAIVQLYLEERWVEPFELKPKPYSLLVHQTLSTLMTYGELSPAELAKSVLQLPSFHKTITQDEYKVLLRHMVANDFLERLESGGIIVGLKGERITNHYSFYAVFQNEQAYHVMSKDGEVGTLASCPSQGEMFVLAGRAWKVQAIDDAQKTVYVQQVKNRNIPSWNGSGGHIHTKIVQRMRQVLLEDTVYSYLRPNAVELLRETRRNAGESGILQNKVLPTTNNTFLLCPWVGSKELKTIETILSYTLKDELQIYSIKAEQHFLRISANITPEAFTSKMAKLKLDTINSDSVVANQQKPIIIDKYDDMIPDELLRMAYYQNELSVPIAVSILNQLGVNFD